MSGLSSALKVMDLDDFITPSQACVKPVEIPKGMKSGAVKRDVDGSVVEVTDDGETRKLEQAKISLNDCLACSGCVTSAEAVLVSSQSNNEFLSVLEARMHHVVVSISPQSRASLARRFHLETAVLHRKLITFLKSLGVSQVFDTVFARDMGLLAEAKLFVDSYRTAHGDASSAMQLDGDSLSSAERRIPFPMLNSACPGWVCYAEKTHGKDIVPHMSPVKSPQQITGSLVKEFYAKDQQLPVYHVTIMPCYDKKLEASRDDFYHDLLGAKEVDCVLTTGEIVDLLEEKGCNITEMEESAIDGEFSASTADGRLQSFTDMPSGGFGDFVFKYAAQELFGKDLFGQKLEYSYPRRKNRDMREIELKIEQTYLFPQINGETKLRFALAYGFRNIQTIVTKIKNKRCPYDYVEVMACPSACSNGGGQVRAREGEDPKEILSEVEELYAADMEHRSYEDWKVVEKTFDNLLPSSASKERGVFTAYYARESLLNPLLEKW